MKKVILSLIAGICINCAHAMQFSSYTKDLLSLGIILVDGLERVESTIYSLRYPLHGAILQKDLLLIKKLLKSKPSLLEKQDSEGRTPLLHACFGGHRKIASVLLDAGANVNVSKEYMTPLRYVAGWDDTTTILIELLNKGANINYLDDKGNNIIMQLIRQNPCTFGICPLIEKGIDCTTKNNVGDDSISLLIESYNNHINLEKQCLHYIKMLLARNVVVSERAL